MDGLICKLLIILSVLGSCWAFESGHSYKYSYLTNVVIDRPSLKNHSIGPKSGAVRLSGVIEISTLWEREGDYLMKLKVLNARVGKADDPGHHTVKQITAHPVYFSRKLGGNMVIYRSLDDSLESVNIKQGIINLLMYQTQPGNLKELDISGECDVTYGREGRLVTKVKTKCVPRQITGQFTNPDKFWGLNMNSTYKATYDIDDMQTLKLATSEEHHIGQTDINRRVGFRISQRQELSLLGSSSCDTVTGAELDIAVKNVRQGQSLVESLLSSELEQAYCESKKKTEARAVVEKYRDDLDKVNTALPEAARAFLHVVAALRQTNKQQILEILNDPENFYLVNELIDACVAADTKDSQEALQEFLVFDDEMMIEQPERYLFAMAFTTHPSQDNILRLQNLVTKGIASKEVRTSTLLSLGALLRTYQRTIDRYSLPFVTDVQNWLLTSLNGCENPECKIMFLGALRNGALPGSLPTILYYAEHAEHEPINMAALDALSRFDSDILTNEAKKVLFSIYQQFEQEQPLSVRVAAVDHLLNTKLTLPELNNVMTSAKWLPSNESAAYIMKRIMDLGHNDEYYKKLVAELKSDSTKFNYNTMATGGGSAAMTSPFIQARDVGSSYSLFIEKTPSGLLQKSITDVIARTANHNLLPLVRVGIHTDGLDSIASYFGGSDDTATDGKEPSAGLKLSILGVGLRPIQFFSTQGEMMSALWNAPSEPISALQGNILLHDHSALLSLSNGLTVDVQLQSCLSLDLSGAVSVSLWNRQAQSFVRTSGSFVLQGDTHLHSALFSLGLNYTLESTGEVQFTSEVDFYDTPISQCMQMMVPEFDTSLRVTRRWSVPQQRAFQKTTEHERVHNAHSFLLDSRNTHQCIVMDAKKDSYS